MIPKWPWTQKGQRYLLCIKQLPWLPDINPFHSVESCFRVTGHFETCVPNDPTLTLNTKRSKVPHIHMTTRPYSQISIPFTLRLTIFELQAIFSSAWLCQQSSWNRNSSVCPSLVQLSLNLMYRFLSNFGWCFPWAIRSGVFAIFGKNVFLIFSSADKQSL